MNDLNLHDPELPEGTVTFLFTDIEGSTQLLRRLGEKYITLLAEHHRMLRDIFARWNGREIDTEGDAFFVSFPRAGGALAAVVEAQRALAEHEWPGGESVKVRMALHTGEPWTAGERYVGMDVHRAARIAHVGYGGQVLLSETTTSLVRGNLPEGVDLLDLGCHRLKDMQFPEHMCQLSIEGLPSDFPPLRSLGLVAPPDRPGQEIAGWPAEFRHNLPVDATPFVGRQTELEALDAYIAESGVKLVTIVGAGGMGKTRLALACARRYLSSDSPFPHGVFFVDLAPLTEAEQVIPILADALEFPLKGQDADARRQLLFNHLTHKKMLLLFDNFEHLPDGRDLLADMSEIAPEVQILVTSRERLQLRIEQVYLVEGLEIPETPGDAADYAAAQLFVQSARRGQPNFALRDGGDRTYLERICRTVAGMPLALELAASWVDTLPLAEIATELQRGLDLLETDMRDMPERHRTIRAAIDYSWRKLEDEERAIFARLSVFRGGFRRVAAGDVTGASIGWLARLVNKTFLQYSRAHDRYQVHELLRQYGAEKLAEDREKETTVRDRHSAFYCAALQRWDKQLKGAGQLEALADFENESANARSAWYRALETGQFALLDPAADGLGRLYLWRRRFHEGENAFSLAAEGVLRALVADEASMGAAEMNRLLAKFQLWRSLFCDREEAEELVKQALEILESPELENLDTRRERAFGSQRAGDLAFERDNDEARLHYRQSLALYRELGDDCAVAELLTALGWQAAHHGATEEARRLGEEAVALARASADRKRTADVLWLLGTLACVHGRIEESGRLLSESLDMRVTLGDRITDIASGHIDLGMPLTWIGRMADADAVREEALALYQAQGQVEQIATAHLRLAMSKGHIGDFEESVRHAQIGLELCREVDDQHGVGLALWFLGSFAIVAGEIDRAKTLLQESLAVFQRLGGVAEVGWVYAVLAEVARRQGRPAAAKRHICESLRLASGVLGLVAIQFSLLTYIILLADEGQEERAVEMCALIDKLPYSRASAAVQKVYMEHFGLVKAALPADVVAAAEARGRARDLHETAAEVVAELELVVAA